MIKDIRESLNKFVSEAGACCWDFMQPVPDKLYFEGDEEDEEDEDDDTSESLISKEVHDGKVETKVKRVGDTEKPATFNQKKSLAKARLTSNSPLAKLKRKRSMLTRKRKVDHDK